MKTTLNHPLDRSLSILIFLLILIKILSLPVHIH